jgi:hypothetical protein
MLVSPALRHDREGSSWQVCPPVRAAAPRELGEFSHVPSGTVV